MSQSGVIERIRALLPTMPGAQRTIAELALGDPAAVAGLTIVELAERCGVSTGTITRFCRSLNLNGYAALRIALASDSGRTGPDAWVEHIGTNLTEADDIQQVARVISANIGHVVTEAIANLDLAAVERAAGLLAAARRVMVYGVSGSATTASELQQRLCRIGLPAWTFTDTHMALTGAALMSRGDVLVVFSQSGRTREVVDLLTEARSHGVRTVALTSDLTSPVARQAELVLATKVHPAGFSTQTILGRHAQLAVLDVLYIAVTQRTFEQTTEAMALTAQAIRPYKVDDAADTVDTGQEQP
ncbi:MurR/RpiR family transcriptional regulator [Nonomuraea sp. CA-143628]|uniref:MurR/RpiR family transcriptional regulator n=1 Tax=Nonomuraea sp. CA-143628 TaxID=3239997 RepID=UPI003D8AC85D